MDVLHELHEIVVAIGVECKGATHGKIKSAEYAEKFKIIDDLVEVLIMLHPRWSAEDRELPHWDGVSERPELSYAEPLPQMFERSEDLYWAWKFMRADDPTIHSLLTGIPEFTKALNSLMVNGQLD